MTENEPLILRPDQRVDVVKTSMDKDTKKLLIDSYNEVSKQAREEGANYARLRGTAFLATFGVPSIISSNIQTDNPLHDAGGALLIFFAGYLIGSELNKKFHREQYLNRQIREFADDKKHDLIREKSINDDLLGYKSIRSEFNIKSDANSIPNDLATKSMKIGFVAALGVVAVLNAYPLWNQNDVKTDEERIQAVVEYVEDLIAKENVMCRAPLTSELK